MKRSTLLLIMGCISSMDASPIRLKRGLYTAGYNYGTLPTFLGHPYQAMSSYVPSTVIHGASYGTPIAQAATYGTPVIQTPPYGSHFVQAGTYRTSVMQGANLMQPIPYSTPIINPASMTKYIAVPKYLRIPLSKYMNPWNVGHGIYLPKYYHSVSRS